MRRAESDRADVPLTDREARSRNLEAEVKSMLRDVIRSNRIYIEPKEEGLSDLWEAVCEAASPQERIIGPVWGFEGAYSTLAEAVRELENARRDSRPVDWVVDPDLYRWVMDAKKSLAKGLREVQSAGRGVVGYHTWPEIPLYALPPLLSLAALATSFSPAFPWQVFAGAATISSVLVTVWHYWLGARVWFDRRWTY